MTEVAYRPHPGTLADRALNFIGEAARDKPAGAWISNTVVSEALCCLPNLIRPSLDRAIEVGLIEKSLDSKGFTQWRIPSHKPPRVLTKKKAPQSTSVRTFSIDWPPGFVPRFDTVKVASYEERRK